MFYYQRDRLEALTAPAQAISNGLKDIFLGKVIPKSSPLRGVGAMLDIIHRWTRPSKHPVFNIKEALVNGRAHDVQEKVVLSKPFCHLKLFEKKSLKKAQPKVLIVAPLSGHYATLLRDTVQTMLQDHEVYITDWISAYDVPVGDGYFNLDTYVDYLKEFHEFLGPNTHVMAVCQPCVPVLMSVALMAQENVSYQPKSMILMGGPVDTRSNPTEVNKIADRFSLAWFKKNMVSKIPAYAKGADRKVTPGNLILSGFMGMNLGTHVQKHQEHVFNILLGNEKAIQAHRSFYDEYLTVMDIPAEYFLQTVDKVFQRKLLPLGHMDYRGQLLDFKAITSTALMTVEGENDDITGIGQTYAAHQICPNIPKSHRDHFLRTEVGHYGIFSGSRWRKDIYPRIRDFIKTHNE